MNLQPAPNGFYCPDDPGEPGLGNQRWSVNETEARLLSELFRNLLVLEIGTGLGVSTRKIAETAKFVHTVDIDTWVKEAVVPDLPENVIFYDDISRVPELLDGAFIDGFHSLNQCRLDIIEAKRIVKKGGIIVFHDTKMENIAKAIRESGLPGLSIITTCGMAVCWNDL